MTRRGLLLRVLALYPSWWRRRYGEEAAAILEHSSPSLRAGFDLLRGAADAWMRQRPPHEGFARFTDQARRVVALAQEEARALRHNYVGTEHVLLGLLAAREGTAARALEALGLTPDRVRARLIQILEGGAQPSTAKCSRWRAGFRPPAEARRLTPRVKRGFELSCQEADRRGDRNVDTAHLLLGLLREGKGVGVHILVELGADPVRVREQLARLTDR